MLKEISMLKDTFHRLPVILVLCVIITIFTSKCKAQIGFGVVTSTIETPAPIDKSTPTVLSIPRHAEPDAKHPGLNENSEIPGSLEQRQDKIQNQINDLRLAIETLAERTTSYVIVHEQVRQIGFQLKTLDARLAAIEDELKRTGKNAGTSQKTLQELENTVAVIRSEEISLMDEVARLSRLVEEDTAPTEETPKWKQVLESGWFAGSTFLLALIAFLVAL
jgi:hypothetical protein